PAGEETTMTQASLVLRAPSANRVYAQVAGALARAEAHWVLGAHLGAAPRVRERTVGGMGALEVQPDDDAPTDTLGRLLGSLSSALDVVEQSAPAASAAPLLCPRELPAVLHHPADLETILRYPGKTNEQFTALLINLAAALSTRRAGLLNGTLSLLDPLFGRGTTLNRALRLGLSPVGAEIDGKDVEAYREFLGAWLKDHRYKHTLEATRLTVRGQQLGTRIEVDLAPDKQTRSDGGVQHGSRAGGRWQRAPRDVLAAAAPGWRRLLRDGAGLALAVNRRTLGHEEASAVLADSGLRVLSRDGAFRHRVDRSIDRDVLLAVPTSHPRVEQLTALAADQEDHTP